MMTGGFCKITGVQQVIRNLLMSKQKVGRGLARGLKKGGVFLQRESMKEVPVQLGNLRGSAFTRAFGQGLETDVIVGYTASYAAYVHEDPDKAHGAEFNRKHAAEIAYAKERGLRSAQAQGGMFKRGEGQKYKFLEDPAKNKRREILWMIAREGRRL